MNQALDTGAQGYSKIAPDPILGELHTVYHSGETYMPLHLMQDEPNKKAVDTGPLSGREMTVLGHLGEGRKNKEIADAWPL